MKNWTDLYLRWHLPMQRMAYVYLKDRYSAEDIVHDIFLRLMEKNISPQFIEHPEAYLKSALYLRCVSMLRMKKATFSIDEWDAQQYATNTTEQTILYRELQQQHFAAIRMLPPREKEIYMLSRIDGYKKLELSILLCRSKKTIKKQMQVSARKVRDALVERIA